MRVRMTLADEHGPYAYDMLRLDVKSLDDEAQPGITQFYGGGSVYCLTPTTEAIARGLGQRLQPAPVHAYELPAPSTEKPDDEYAYDGPDDPECF